MKQLLFIAAGLGTFVTVGGVVAHSLVNDLRVPRTNLLVGKRDCVLVITAHPDDEIAMSGTLATGVSAGAKVHLACLSHGEASKAATVGGIVGAEAIGVARLSQVREQELRLAAKELGIETVTFFAGHDGKLGEEYSQLFDQVTNLALQIRPTVIISLDEAVGLYGHPDHVVSAQIAHDLFNLLSVSQNIRYFQLTLPSKQVILATRFSPVFQQAVADSSGGHPVPSIAVKIARFGKVKFRAAAAHASQASVIADTLPLVGKIPQSLYFRLFDREYFAEVFSSK